MHWTKPAGARLLPYPGDEWTLATNLAKSEKAIAKFGESVPSDPSDLTVETEVARGVAARLDHRYNEKGNHPKDTLGRDLVDVWCARRDVVFATEVLIAIVRTRPAKTRSPTEQSYAIRWDGQPWGRLREHLLTAAPDQLARAHAIALKARKKPAGSLLPALSYAFCDQDWARSDLDAAIDAGRGDLAVVAALADPHEAMTAVRRVMDPEQPRYQLIEETVQHMPNVMSRLGDDGVELVLEAAALAWDRASRKPWLDLVGCYDTDAARAFVEKHSAKK